jgi:hypothetical protein
MSMAGFCQTLHQEHDARILDYLLCRLFSTDEDRQCLKAVMAMLRKQNRRLQLHRRGLE